MKHPFHHLLALCALATSAFAQDAPAQALPKVVLLGDSIREGYAPFVAELLAGPELRKAGATFDRFGLFVDERGDRPSYVYPDDVTYTIAPPK